MNLQSHQKWAMHYSRGNRAGTTTWAAKWFKSLSVSFCHPAVPAHESNLAKIPLSASASTRIDRSAKVKCICSWGTVDDYGIRMCHVFPAIGLRCCIKSAKRFTCLPFSKPSSFPRLTTPPYFETLDRIANETMSANWNSLLPETHLWLRNTGYLLEL